MILFPAIDILQGRAVRLLYGDYSRVTDYGDPVEMAMRWADEGAEFLHVVDLDGARSGTGDNAVVVRDIVKATGLPVQLGGGIRTLLDVERRLNETGVARVILGTVCCQNPEIVKSAVRMFGAERIVAGIDAKDGRVAVNGWIENTEISSLELGMQMVQVGLRYVVYTDIGRDGALTGVNISACVEMMRQTGLHCIASGGVSNLNDLTQLKQIDMYGAILGRAIYEKNFTVKEALKCIRKV